MYPSSYKSRQDRNIDTDGWSQPAWLTLEDVLSTLWWGWKTAWLEVMTLPGPGPAPSLRVILEQWRLSLSKESLGECCCWQLTRDDRNFRSNISISDSENPQLDDEARDDAGQFLPLFLYPRWTESTTGGTTGVFSAICLIRSQLLFLESKYSKSSQGTSQLFLKKTF